jgi:hypothetical protein
MVLRKGGRLSSCIRVKRRNPLVLGIFNIWFGVVRHLMADMVSIGFNSGVHLLRSLRGIHIFEVLGSCSVKLLFRVKRLIFKFAKAKGVNVMLNDIYVVFKVVNGVRMVNFSGLGLMINFLQLRNRALRQDLVVQHVKLVCKESGQLNLVCLMSLLIYFGLSFHQIRISALDKPNVIFNLILIF